MTLPLPATTTRGDTRATRWRDLMNRVANSYFLFTLLVFVAVGIPAYFYLARTMEHRFIENYEHFAAEGASVVFAEHLSTVPGGRYTEPLEGKELDEFLDHVDRDIAIRSLLKTKVWRVDGMLLYSSNGEGTGEIRPPSDEFAELATSGTIAEVEIDHPEVPGEQSAGKVLEIYLPIFDVDGRLANVIELYYSVGPLEADIAAMRWTLLGVLGTLFVAVAVVGQVGSRLLIRRNRQLRAYSEEIQRIAVTDALTGVANRRNFHDRLAEGCATAARHARPLSLVIVDLDFFKAINDQYGHQTGDAVLAAVAHTLRDAVRRTDTVARYGGEEFAVVMPDTTEAEAVFLSERLHQAIKAATIQAGDATISVTASFGVAQYPIAGRDEASLVAAADSALYMAKGTGRDRVCTFSGIAGSSPASANLEGLINRLRHAEAFTIEALAAAVEGAGVAPVRARILQLATKAAKALRLSEQDERLLALAVSLHGSGCPNAPSDGSQARSANPALSPLEADAIRAHPDVSEEIIASVDGFGGLLQVMGLGRVGNGTETERAGDHAGAHTGHIAHVLRSISSNALHRGPTPSSNNEAVNLDPITQSAPLTRVLRVIATYVSLTTDRPGRPALAHAEAVRELIAQAGRRLDPSIVATLVATVLKEPPEIEANDPAQGANQHLYPIPFRSSTAPTSPAPFEREDPARRQHGIRSA